MWQEIIVGICVLTALLFLIRRWLFPATQKSASCGGCNNCSPATDKCGNSSSSTIEPPNSHPAP
jgi:hypothetical protein